jgi:N-acyl-D-amino-acid deacylase
VAYFSMSEENVRKQVRLPWVSFASDADAPSLEGIFLKQGYHPRSFGNFARLLGRYVRDEQQISLAEAVRKLTSLPAEHLSLADRGRLRRGYFADVVVFDPATIKDMATYENPAQYSQGVDWVLVNGKAVVADGKPTNALPGHILRGPGYSPGSL